MSKKESTPYESLSEIMQFVVDCYATFWSPARIEKGIRENFGEPHAVKLQTVVAYRSQFEDLILEKRKELGARLPIINPASRFEMAQEVYNMSIIGIPRVIKGGGIVEIPDPKTAVMAIKLAHDMSSTKEGGEIQDSDIIRGVVKEAYQRIQDANPDMDNQKIISVLMESLEQDALPYIQELNAPAA